MRKRICFALDADEDKDTLRVLEQIPKCLRGSFIKVALSLDINVEKDKDILESYPDFLNNPMRYEIIKGLLRKHNGQGEGKTDPKVDSRDTDQWSPPAFEIPIKRSE